MVDKGVYGYAQMCRTGISTYITRSDHRFLPRPNRQHINLASNQLNTASSRRDKRKDELFSGWRTSLEVLQDSEHDFALAKRRRRLFHTADERPDVVYR